MSAVTTHVLDTASGRPAAGVPVTLERRRPGERAAATAWEPVGSASTDADGRCRTLLPAGTGLAKGAWRLTFDTGAYFRSAGVAGFYPHVAITFEVRDPAQDYHVPLLLSPYGYATYRGS